MKTPQTVSRFLHFASRLPGFRGWTRLLYGKENKRFEKEVMGIRFRHPVGLAPGFDRNGSLTDELSQLGFSFIGVETGNLDAKAIIENLGNRDQKTKVFAELQVAGVSEEAARKDASRCFALYYDFVDFFVIHGGIAGMSALDDDLSGLSELLEELIDLRLCYDQYTPILIRIPERFDPEQVRQLLDFCQLSGIDGVVVSGATRIRDIIAQTKGRLPVIGTGSIEKPEEAIELLEAGASLVEVGSGFLHVGSRLPQKILKLLEKQSVTI